MVIPIIVGTMKCIAIAAAILVFSLSSAIADEKEDAARKLVLENTEVIHVEPPDRPERFRPDYKLETLQILTVGKDYRGANRVAANGEFIIVREDVADEEMSQLFGTALKIKIEQVLGTRPPLAP